MSATAVPKYDQKPIVLVCGVGSGTGTGNAVSREFAKNGYRVAMVARQAKSLEAAAQAIRDAQAGNEAHGFPISGYVKAEMTRVFKEVKEYWKGAEIRVAVFNTGHRIARPFLELSQADIDTSINVNIFGAFAFAQEAILTFREYEINSLGYRGALIFTSATSAWRGNPTFAAFAAAKHGVRGLAMSLNKEFGKQNIHVSHCIVDGVIKTNATVRAFGQSGSGKERLEDLNGHLDPASIAKAYWYLAHQDRQAWTFELDVRPAHEDW